jgi:hypothetical protein
MSNPFEPQEFDCDAPPYSVVQACDDLGFQSPLDVRWCRMSQFGAWHNEQPALFNLGAWEWFFRRRPPPDRLCLCGQPLPLLERFTFTFRSERRADYFLGQCGHCHTIFWDEARVTPSERKGRSVT